MAISITFNYINDGGTGTGASDWYYLNPNAMAGGLGNDVYEVNASSGLITENVNEGTDKVISSIDYTLGANVENLTLNAAGLTGTGNALNNVMQGTSGTDTLEGGLGNDTYYATMGDTIIESGLTAGGIDTVASTASYNLTHLARSDANYDSIENITLLGNARNAIGNGADNTLTGNSANNILNGKAGADTMIGGEGNDIYVVDNTGDTIVETGVASLYNNQDMVYVSINNYNMSANANNVEKAAFFGVNNLNIIGNDLDNTFIIDDVTNGVSDGGNGTDLVVSSVDYDLGLGSNVENLTLTAAGLTGTGNELGTVMRGTGGTDTFAGGLGDDTYYVTRGDTIIETGLTAGGIDTVVSTSSYNLTHLARSDANYDSVENITLLGYARSNAIGNGADNTLTGNGANNILNGKAGDDTLDGGGGNDILYGDSGADTFVFSSILNKGTRDQVLDFNSTDGDKIGLSADIFSNITDASTAMSDGFISQSGGMLYYDAAGTGVDGAGVAFAQIMNAVALTDGLNSDFVMV